MFVGVVADRVKQMGLSQADIAIEKKRIVDHAGILAGGDTACVSQPVARPDHKTLKGIIRVQTEIFRDIDLPGIGLDAGIEKMNRYQMPCDILSRLHEGRRTVVLEILGTGLIGAGDLHQAVIECGDVQVVKPLTHIHRVDGLNPIQNIVQNFSRTLFDHITPFLVDSDRCLSETLLSGERIFYAVQDIRLYMSGARLSKDFAQTPPTV